LAFSARALTSPAARPARPSIDARRRVIDAKVAARVKHLYVAFVSFALGVAGTAIGFTVGVVPYFRSMVDLTRYDGFFLASILVCTSAGFIIGLANGAKWYRALDASPLSQKRMLAYMHRRNAADRDAGVRSLNAAGLRQLLGNGRRTQA
jgi:hypothetical protein